MTVTELTQCLMPDCPSLMQLLRLLIEQRIQWLEDHEPDDGNAAYDKWSDNRDGLTELIETIEKALTEGLTTDNILNIVVDVSVHQSMYGGLARWKGATNG